MITKSVEDELFNLKSEFARERRELNNYVDEMNQILSDIWRERGLTKKLWERIAECLEQPEEDIPITYDPTPITQSDFLKIQQRLNKIERAVFAASSPGVD